MLTGTVGAYDYDGIVALQGRPDPNNSRAFYRSTTFYAIVLDTPQTLTALDIDDNYSSRDAKMIYLGTSPIGSVAQYIGQHVVFSIDPALTYWPSDTRLPLGEPGTSDIHILG